MWPRLPNWLTRRAKSEQQLLGAVMSRKLPPSVAVIMDGNGRWATRRGMPRWMGHRAGVEAFHRIVDLSGDLGLQCLTVYAFSTENWRRSKEEVDTLMGLLVEYLVKETPRMHQRNVRIRTIGRIEDLPNDAQLQLAESQQLTADNTGLVLVLALNYGGRPEIIDAAREICRQARAGSLQPEDVTEESFAKYLYTSDFPDPDLLIRTSGEMRLSNFLLWQLAYAEMVFVPVLWPSFSRRHFLQALQEFQSRNRRFGGTKSKR